MQEWDRGQAEGPRCSQRPHDKEGWNDTRADPLLPEQRRGWSLMIFCARATRGLRRPSLDARTLGAPKPLFQCALVGRGAHDGNHLVAP
jgi:hypothetical protein